MNDKLTNKLLMLLMALTFLTACNNDDTPGNKPTPDNKYLTDVTAEKHISKSEMTTIVADYAASQGIDLPEMLLGSLLCDVDVAAITYTTTGPDGNDVTASGVVAIPSGMTSYDHLLSIQHGTLNIEEAPSEQLFYYEMMPVVGKHIVVMADYLGYGASRTEDRQHPYLHAQLTGTACADMIEAAREYLRDRSITETDDAIELLGYSQGGQATVATQLELERRGRGGSIRKVWAGGGPYDLENLLQAFLTEGDMPTSYPRSGYLPYLIRGMAYGEQLSVSDENLYAPVVIEKGLNRMFSTRPLSEWHEALGTDITQVLHPDFFAAPDFNGNADVQAIVAALRKNSLVNATTRPQATLNLYHSPLDDFVPYSNAASAHAIWSNSTLTDLTMPGHVLGGIEFILRYMGLWDLVGPMLGGQVGK